MIVLKVLTNDGMEQRFERCHGVTRDGVLMVLEDVSKRCVAAYTSGDWKRFALVEADERIG